VWSHSSRNLCRVVAVVGVVVVVVVVGVVRVMATSTQFHFHGFP